MYRHHNVKIPQYHTFTSICNGTLALHVAINHTAERTASYYSITEYFIGYKL